MEFSREAHHAGLDISRLKNLLTIDNLTRLCASISSAIPSSENEGDLYCIWGAFNVRRDEIRNGVRYALTNCPHALAWTVTYDEARQNLIVHCTIDKTHQDLDFIESIHEFVSDWSNGMRKALQQ
jgi:hypothetical protein